MKRNIDGEIPLQLACRFNKKEVEEVLLQNNSKEQLEALNWNTSLHNVPFYGHPKLVKAICENVVNKEELLLQKNDSGETPLHLACKFNEKEIVDVLLSDHIDKQKLIKEANEIYGNTPLHVAALLGHHEIVEMILNKCSDVNEVLQLPNKLKDSPVHAAASRGHVE